MQKRKGNVMKNSKLERMNEKLINNEQYQRKTKNKNNAKRVSEFTSYSFIKKELERCGWNTKNPERSNDGQVYTQQECLDNEEIEKFLGKQKPEYVVKLSEDEFYVIEAKPLLDNINDAFEEAEGYAKLINKSDYIKATIISGVAGNDEDGYEIKSAYLENGEFKPINYDGKEITGIVSPELAEQLRFNMSASIKTLNINEEHLLKTAEEINEILHIASINKDERASVMATLLLAMIDDTRPNYNASPAVFVKDINSRAEEILISRNKRDFFKHIEIKLPGKKEAQKKYKKALVLTIFSLHRINIKAAMNSGTDILGKFYEVFLKYGNGAKDIGIVLTPRHITRFACNVLSINHSDLVYDPTCGTGGFLVAAFDYVRMNSSEEQTNEFKKHRIFGIEQQPKIAALAVVNMIFRKDGSSHIEDNDCLSISLKKMILNSSKTAEYVKKGENVIEVEGKVEKQLPVTKVLMKPPFSLKSQSEKEYKFIQHALEQMEDGGVLFAIVPVSVMVKGRGCLSWRREQLLKYNTLISVISLPEKLFYPVGVHTCAIIVRKGIRHEPQKEVLWLRCTTDGFVIKKGVRKFSASEENAIEQIESVLKSYILDDSIEVKNKLELQKKAPIDFSDNLLELVPEVYLDQRKISIDEVILGIEKLTRENAAFQIRNNLKGDERK